jgi:hypothetical protein
MVVPVVLVIEPVEGGAVGGETVVVVVGGG